MSAGNTGLGRVREDSAGEDLVGGREIECGVEGVEGLGEYVTGCFFFCGVLTAFCLLCRAVATVERVDFCLAESC